MLIKRIIPVLLLKDRNLIHITRFDREKEIYIGDPINVINIFNDYEVDEMILLDVNKTNIGSKVDINYLKIISGEAFFPMSYGGGISSVQEAEQIIEAGFEKIIINNKNLKSLDLSKRCIKTIGSQSVIASVDIINYENNFYLYNYVNNEKVKINLQNYLKSLIEIGVGEICITNVSLDGSMSGSNLEILEHLGNIFKVPIIYKGGAKNYSDIKSVLKTRVSAFASSTLFIMKKPGGGIVLNYPSLKEKEDLYD
tara:strand:+ start:9064 stop:9825 length:762 start_codon:yes stop_codon:yes gene_type:complete